MFLVLSRIFLTRVNKRSGIKTRCSGNYHIKDWEAQPLGDVAFCVCVLFPAGFVAWGMVAGGHCGGGGGCTMGVSWISPPWGIGQARQGWVWLCPTKYARDVVFVSGWALHLRRW